MRLSQYLRSIAKVPSQSSKVVSAAISRRIKADFRKGVDPYGKAWKPLAKSTLAKGRKPPPLTDTGKGKRGITVHPTQGAGIKVVSSVSYMDYHLGKAPGIRSRWNLPIRPFLPDSARGVPPAWDDIFASQWRKQLQKLARQKRVNVHRGK